MGRKGEGLGRKGKGWGDGAGMGRASRKHKSVLKRRVQSIMILYIPFYGEYRKKYGNFGLKIRNIS